MAKTKCQSCKCLRLKELYVDIYEIERERTTNIGREREREETKDDRLIARNTDRMREYEE